MFARKTTVTLAALAIAAGSSIAAASPAHAESVQTWYMAVTSADGQLHKLGSCTAGTQETIWQIPAGARSDIYWINDWPASTIENLTAQQLIDQMTAKGYSGERAGYNWANGPETRADAMVAGSAYEVDCVPVGMEQPGTTNTGTIPLTPVPVVTPTPTPTKPVVAHPAKPATKTVSIRVQVDTDRIRTAAQAKALSSIGTSYTFREDVRWNTTTGRVYSAPLWARGVETHRIVTLAVTMPATATPAQIITVEKAAAAKVAGVTLGSIPAGRIGHTTTSAWLIPAGAWDASTSWKAGVRTAPQILAGSATR